MTSADGGSITQETRHWHEDTGVTTSGREKSDAEDYRYFPEPDLVPVAPSAQRVEELADPLPQLGLGLGALRGLTTLGGGELRCRLGGVGVDPVAVCRDELHLRAVERVVPRVDGDLRVPDPRRQSLHLRRGEALLRGLPVRCFGAPFYSGWGLTEDLAPGADRGRRLDLDALAAATLILYPSYIDPVAMKPCTPEHLLDRLSESGHVERRPHPHDRRARIEGDA